MIEEVKHHRFLIFILALVGLTAVLFSAGNFESNEVSRLEEVRFGKMERVLAALPLDAKAVAVYNLSRSREIFVRNADVPMPLASLAKTMTVLTALHALGTEASVAVSLDAILQSGDYGFRAGEVWKAGELAKVTLLVSSNDGAYPLAEPPRQTPEHPLADQRAIQAPFRKYAIFG